MYQRVALLGTHVEFIQEIGPSSLEGRLTPIKKLDLSSTLRILPFVNCLPSFVSSKEQNFASIKTPFFPRFSFKKNCRKSLYTLKEWNNKC